MPIVYEGRFIRWPDMVPAPGLGLESSKLEECVREINRCGITGVFGSSVWGFYEADLNALARVPHVEAIWFWDVDLKNIDGLYALDALTSFGVHPKRPAVDFSRLPKLKQLVWHHKRQDRGVRDLVALESLHSWRYRDDAKTFHKLDVPPNLVELEINWANCEALDGLPYLPHLRRLGVHRCRNLRSLGPLADLFPKLEHLVVNACGKVEDQEGARVVSQLSSLKHAWVKNRQHIAGNRPLPTAFEQDDNGQTLLRMHEGGDDLSTARDIEFRLVFPDQAQAQAFVQQAPDKFKVSLSWLEEKSVWQVTVKRHMVPSHFGITGIQSVLTEKAEQIGGNLAGWDCANVPRRLS